MALYNGAFPRLPSRPPSHRLHIGTQHFPSLWVDPVRAQTRRADHTLIGIYFVVSRIVSNPAFNNRARTGANLLWREFCRPIEVETGSKEDLAIQLTEGWILGCSPTITNQ
jgi:hypothetical protein